MIKNRTEDKGFTLIELLIVIVILGILATVTVFAVGGITSRGQDSACAAERKTVEVALEAYFAQNGSYPATQAGLVGQFLREAPTNHTTALGVITATGDCVV
jgi:type II secretion system protein G